MSEASWQEVDSQMAEVDEEECTESVPPLAACAGAFTAASGAFTADSAAAGAPSPQPLETVAVFLQSPDSVPEPIPQPPPPGLEHIAATFNGKLEVMLSPGFTRNFHLVRVLSVNVLTRKRFCTVTRIDA